VDHTLPWLQFYGDVPATLDYPRITLYRAVIQAAQRGPEGIAFDFLGTSMTYRLAAELVEHCRRQLIKWSCPREVKFLASLPRTRIGKIDFKALMESEGGPR
jgi:acyl-coenzyme A synthetase/AMP-(fatty) acid ligase